MTLKNPSCYLAIKVHCQSDNPSKLNLPILKDTKNLQIHTQREINVDKKNETGLDWECRKKWAGPNNA